MSTVPARDSRTVDLDAAEQDALEKAIDRLQRLIDRSRTFLNMVADPPREGSAMQEAFAADQRLPFDLARVLIVSAEDHLETIIRVKRTGQLPLFSLYTLLRSAAEAVVRCRHLLSAHDSKVRWARSLNDRLDNLLEMRKLDPDVTGAEFQRRLAKLKKQAAASGIRPKIGQKGRVSGFGEPIANLTDLFRNYLPAGSTAFQFLSGFSHSMLWVILRPRRALPSGEPGLALVPLDLEVDVFVSLLSKVADVHDDNIRLWFAAAGIPSDVWTTAKS